MSATPMNAPVMLAQAPAPAAPAQPAPPPAPVSAPVTAPAGDPAAVQPAADAAAQAETAAPAADAAAAAAPATDAAVQAAAPAADAAGGGIGDIITYLTSNYEWMHEATFIILYGMALVVTFLAIERLIYFAASRGNAQRIVDAFKPGVTSVKQLPEALLRSGSPAAGALNEIETRKAEIHDRASYEDVSDAAYVNAKTKLSAHLWVFDLVVTAAPLLGLLGTILGIIETFTALADAGISDPSAVSKGIGIALFATALGIAVCLYALIFHNVLQERLSKITDLMKVALMRVGAGYKY